MVSYPRYSGTILGIHENGYGFIRSEVKGEGDDIFFRSTELTNVQFDDLRVGDKVGFDAIKLDKGFAAANVGKNGSSSTPFRRDIDIDSEVEDVIPPTDELDRASYGSVEFAVDNFTLSLSKIIAEDPEQIEWLEWRDIERLVAQTFSGLGFDVELTPGSKDGGKDIVITQKGEFGTKSYFVEIKHWKTKVGAGPVLEFLHVVVRDEQSGGLFISTSGFTSGVLESLTQIDRKTIRLGSKNKIVAMCRNYLRVRSGLWTSSQKIEDVMFDDTI